MADYTEFKFHIKEAQSDIKHVNVANGWYEDSRPFSSDVALLHSEVSELYEAYRDWGLEDATFGTEEKPKYRYEMQYPLPKPEGVGSEIADIFIRLLDTCERYDIDLIAEFERKLAFNATRGHKHGGKKE